MGRVKACKIKRSLQNKEKALKRWRNKKNSPGNFNDGGAAKKNLKRKQSPSHDKNSKVMREDQPTLDYPGTSFDNQSSQTHVYFNVDHQSEREKDVISNVKEEMIKEELMLEDYNNFESTNFDEAESRENVREETNAIHPGEVSPSFETVICGAGVQVKQEIVEDETEIAHEPVVEITSLQTTTVIQTEIVSQDTTETHCSSFSENIASLDSLNALARLTNTVGPTNIHPHQVNRENGTLGNSIAAYGQTVSSNQPLVSAATTPNCIGVIITNRDTTTTNYIAAPSAVYSAAPSMNYRAATTIDYSTATSSAPSVTSAQGQPPYDVPPTQTSDREDLEGIFISLKKVPLQRRKKTKDKLLRLVRLISELDLDPDEVSFSVTTK